MDRLEEIGGVLLYIDNSNIFIETQKFGARKKKFPKDIWDNCARVKFVEMLKLVLDGRDTLHAELYGSECHEMDTVWEEVKKSGLRVNLSKRSTWTGKEKMVDTRLTADAVENIIIHRDLADLKNSAFILLSGDKDMLSCVEKAKKYDWKIEVWSYKGALHKDFKNFLQEDDIFYLDDYFEKISYTKTEFDNTKRVHAGKSIVLSHENKSLCVGSTRFRDRVVDIASEIFKCSIMARYITEKSVNNLALITPFSNENFDDSIWKNKEKLLDQVSTEFKLINARIWSYQEFVGKRDQDKLSEEDSNSDISGNIFCYKDGCGPEELETFQFPQRKQKPLKKNRCTFKFHCKFGLECDGLHDEKEKAFFKACREPMKRGLYKTRLCDYYKTLKCRHQNKKYMCPFAHGKDDIRCLACNKHGHDSQQCPKQK